MGKELLSVGLIWCIGNGKTTKIWKDSWIQRPLSNRIQYPVSTLDELTTFRIISLEPTVLECWDDPEFVLLGGGCHY